MGTVDDVARPVLQWQDLVGAATSISNTSSELLVKAYPNPATTMLTIENAPLNASYSIINAIGQVQGSGIITNSTLQLNVESYDKGIYILKVGDNASKIMIK